MEKNLPIVSWGNGFDFLPSRKRMLTHFKNSAVVENRKVLSEYTIFLAKLPIIKTICTCIYTLRILLIYSQNGVLAMEFVHHGENSPRNETALHVETALRDLPRERRLKCLWRNQ